MTPHSNIQPRHGPTHPTRIRIVESSSISSSDESSTTAVSDLRQSHLKALGSTPKTPSWSGETSPHPFGSSRSPVRSGPLPSPDQGASLDAVARRQHLRVAEHLKKEATGNLAAAQQRLDAAGSPLDSATALAAVRLAEQRLAAADAMLASTERSPATGERRAIGEDSRGNMETPALPVHRRSNSDSDNHNQRHSSSESDSDSTSASASGHERSGRSGGRRSVAFSPDASPSIPRDRMLVKLKNQLAKLDQDIGTRESALKNDWACYQDEMLASPWVEVGWNVAAGMAAYLSSFGITMLASRGAVMLVGPWGSATLLAAGALHTLVAEPVAAKLRATTYQNPWSVAQTASLRPLARRTGDRIRQALADLPPKRVFGMGQQTGLTAAEALAHPDQAGFLKNYLGTFFTDDAPFLSFTVLYTAKNYLAELGPYAQGSLPEIGLQLAAGALAGASTMVIAQALRKHIAHGPFDRATGSNLPTVTKPMRLWEAEALHLAVTLAEMDKLLSKWSVPKPDDPDGARPAKLRAEIEQLKERRTQVSAALAVASARSGAWSSYRLDVQKMFAPKRSAQPGVPELPGSRLNTVASMLAKTTSLIATVTVGTLVQLQAAARPAGAPLLSAMEKFVQLAIAPTLLIVPPGFAMRTQIQAALLMVVGAGKAFYDVAAEAVEPGRYAASRAADPASPAVSHARAAATSAMDDEAAMEAGSFRSVPPT